MESLGGVNVSHCTNTHVRPNGPSKQPDKLDVLKYYHMKKTIDRFREKSKGKYVLSDSVKRYWLVFKIHVPSVHALELASPAIPGTAIGSEASRPSKFACYSLDHGTAAIGLPCWQRWRTHHGRIQMALEVLRIEDSVRGYW